MRAVILTADRKGIDVSQLTAPVKTTGSPVVYSNINPINHIDIYKLYHYAIYPHYLSSDPAVYAIKDVGALIKKITSISDPFPVGCPLTGEKAARHLLRLPQVSSINGYRFPEIKPCIAEVSDYLDPEQKQAASHFLGPAMCVAPAGAGKTGTIVSRVEYLVKKGIKPDRILCMTFTRKAQKEMQERLVAKLGREKGSKVMVKTYHALAYMLLTEFKGKPPNILLSRFGVLNKLIYENGLECNKPVREIDSFISFQMNNLVLPDSVRPRNKTEEALFEVYAKYLDYLQETNQIDQDALLLKLHELLRTEAPRRNSLMDFSPPGENKGYPKGRWLFTLVDEAQDNNLAQDVITRFLVGAWDNLFMVGDEDQLLYSFRGSDIERILGMSRVYPNIREIQLKTNYRCHPAIVEVADRAIRNNTQRRDKTIVAARRINGPAVSAITFKHIFDEYEWIALSIKRMIGDGVKPEDIAVLYRTNTQGDALSVIMKEHEVPHYVHRSGPKLFESTEMESVINHLTVVQTSLRGTPEYNSALLGCLRIPRRARVHKKYESAVTGKSPLSEIIKIADRENETSVVEFCHQIGNTRLVAMPNAGTVISYIRSRFSDIEKYFGLGEGIERLDIIESIASRFKSVPEFIKWVNKAKLFTDDNKAEGKVQLMTVHSSKGLEFPRVILVNLTEGHLPHAASIEEGKIEEERRVLYVGITRAQDNLIITGYHDKKKKLSRFLAETGLEIKSVY